MSDPLNPPPHETINQSRILWGAVVFEGGLGALALTLGWIFDYPPLKRAHAGADRWPDLLVGLAAIVPLALAFFLVAKAPGRSFQILRERLESVILPMFRGLSLSDLFLISCLAGIGEELLFRGFLQPALEANFGLVAALVASNVLFGLAHWITRTYAVIAALMGTVLGLSMVYTDNLLAPIVAHALYDFFALWYYLRVLHPGGRAPRPD